MTEALTVLYDHTLGSDAPSIDTGAAAIPAGYASLKVLLIARTADAAASGGVGITFNGDTGANYDDQNLYGNNDTTLGSNGHVAVHAASTIVHGSSGTANYPGTWSIDIPGYDQTTFFKVGTFLAGIPDGSLANEFAVAQEFGWRSTAAINQITVTGVTADLKAGSRLVILGVGGVPADETITGLTDGGAVQPTDELVIARSGGNNKITGSRIASAGIIGVKKYAPGTLATYTVSNTSGVTALDTTNLTVPFIIPDSGNVLVRFSAVMGAGVGGVLGFALLNHSGGAQIGETQDNVWADASANSPRMTVEWYLTGLTPGASLQLDIAAGVSSGSASASVFAQGHTGAVDGGKVGPALFVVQAA